MLVVTHDLAKVELRVRSPSPAPSIADMAQSVERILGKDEVTSSILVISTSYNVYSR